MLVGHSTADKNRQALRLRRWRSWREAVAADEGRARIVRFTKRGRAVHAVMIDVLRDIEREWSAELGTKRFAELKELLFRVWESPLIR